MLNFMHIFPNFILLICYNATICYKACHRLLHLYSVIKYISFPKFVSPLSLRVTEIGCSLHEQRVCVLFSQQKYVFGHLVNGEWRHIFRNDSEFHPRQI